MVLSVSTTPAGTAGWARERNDRDLYIQASRKHFTKKGFPHTHTGRHTHTVSHMHTHTQGVTDTNTQTHKHTRRHTNTNTRAL